MQSRKQWGEQIPDSALRALGGCIAAGMSEHDITDSDTLAAFLEGQGRQQDDTQTGDLFVWVAEEIRRGDYQTKHGEGE